MSPAIKKMAWHVIAWATYTAIGIAVFGYRMGISNAVPETLISFSVSAFIFYAHYYVLKRTLEKRKPVPYVIGLTILVAVNFLLKYFSFTTLYPYFFKKPSSIEGSPLTDLFLAYTWQSLTFFMFSAGYWFAAQLLRKRDQGHEYDKLQLENASLRAQINPHFLFNTLDSFRIESKHVLPEMSLSIASLIELMRSAFSTPDANGLINLDREVRAVESLINIYRRRFPYIHMLYKKEMPEAGHFLIPPHVLLTFAENAFKHGDYTDPVRPLRIELSVTETGLELLTYNKKEYRIMDESRGIGMKYIVRQLESTYEGRYELHIGDGDYDYSVRLKISWL